MRASSLIAGAYVALGAVCTSTAVAMPVFGEERKAFPSYAYALIAPAQESASQLIVRTTQKRGEACPTLATTDSTSGISTATPLSVRPGPMGTGESFSDVSVCETAVPTGASGSGTVTFANGAQMTVPTAINSAVDTIAAIGDTGCRLEDNMMQDCATTHGWPLRSFARQIAKARPDAVIHLGDYFYDSAPCPKADRRICGDVPPVIEGQGHQDSAASFDFEFLSPFSPVFPVAPLLPMRGNQETCNKDGISYFYFLDPHFGTSRTCDPRKGKTPVVITRPYAVDLPTSTDGNLRLVVTDTTYGNDTRVDEWAEKTRPDFARAHALASQAPTPGSSWLLTHRPAFAIRSGIQCGDIRCSPFSRNPRVNHWISADVAAASYGLLEHYDAILSGHVHLTQAVQVKGAPAQFVLGAGGTSLDPKKGYTRPKFGALASGLGDRMDAKYKPYPSAKDWTTRVEFSYGMGTAVQGGWNVEAVTVKDRVIAHCELRGSEVNC